MLSLGQTARGKALQDRPYAEPTYASDFRQERHWDLPSCNIHRPVKLAPSRLGHQFGRNCSAQGGLRSGGGYETCRVSFSRCWPRRIVSGPARRIRWCCGCVAALPQGGGRTEWSRLAATARRSGRCRNPGMEVAPRWDYWEVRLGDASEDLTDQEPRYGTSIPRLGAARSLGGHRPVTSARRDCCRQRDLPSRGGSRRPAHPAGAGGVALIRDSHDHR